MNTMYSQNYSNYSGKVNVLNISNDTQNISSSLGSVDNLLSIAGFNKNVSTINKTFQYPKDIEMPDPKDKENPAWLSSPPTRGSSDIKRILNLCAPSVVALYSLDLSTSGSGVILNNKGQILTNWHVVDGYEKVYTYFFNEKISGSKDLDLYEYYVSNVVAIDKMRDLALLQIEESSSLKIPKTAILANENRIEVGDNTYAIGHPQGLAWTPSFGWINRIRDEYEWEYEYSNHQATVIQMSTPIAPGSSGGPLFNDNGRLIGIVSMGFALSQGFNFAIHGTEIKDFIRRVKKGEYAANFDTNENFNDKNWVALDADSNGIIDGYRLIVNGIIIVKADSNEDQTIDVWLMDTNNDDEWDIQVFDKDGNGLFEYFLVDENFDGTFDKVRIDTNGDEVPDVSFDYK